MKHWLNQEKETLKRLKTQNASDDQCAVIMNRSAASIRDMWVKLNDQLQERYGATWEKEEDIALILGMKNEEFLPKYKRGQKETNQRRFDLLRPNGKLLHLHPEVRNNIIISVPPIQPSLNIIVEPVAVVPIINMDTEDETIDEVLPFSKKILRKTIEKHNRRLRNIPADKSANVSTYQYGIVHAIFRTTRTRTQELTIHDSDVLEMKAVTLALFELMVDIM